MECIILIGIPASGKSTFYRERFFNTHMRINLDMLKTRHREQIYVQASLEAKQPFVVDNTNPAALDRQKYIEAVRPHRFRVIGYYFEPDAEASLQRNQLRTGKNRVPDKAIPIILNQLEEPCYSEGFDELYRVTLQEGQFGITVIERVK